MTDTNGKSSPQVFVVRADGHVLHNGPVPGDLAGFLRGQLDQGGQPLSADQAAKLDKTFAAARELATAGDDPSMLWAIVGITTLAGPLGMWLLQSWIRDKRETPA